MFATRYFNLRLKPIPFVFINEDRVQDILNWEQIYPAMEEAIGAVSRSNTVQPPRTILNIPNTQNAFLAMPAYMSDSKYGTLACKMLSIFPQNKDVPAIISSIMIFCEVTGQLKAVVAANHITGMRTATASVVATKTVFKPLGDEPLVLGIYGAGMQGTAHAEAFYHFFKLKEVRIMDRQNTKAKKLAMKLNKKYKCKNVFRAVDSGPVCAKDADIIITATFSSSPVVRESWLKSHCHLICLSGTDGDRSEIDEETYKCAEIYTDCMETFRRECPTTIARNFNVKGEIRSYVDQDEDSQKHKRTIFQYLGTGIEDAITAKLVYDLDQHKDV